VLAKRLGIAALVLIGLYGLVAVRPFGTPVSEATENPVGQASGDDFELSVEELPSGEPTIHLNSPQGDQTYVLRRLPNGELVITKDEDTPPAPSVAPVQDITESPENVDNLRSDLDEARNTAVNALKQLNEAQSALDAAEPEPEPEPATRDQSGAERTLSDSDFEDMVLSAIEESEDEEAQSAIDQLPRPQIPPTVALSTKEEIAAIEERKFALIEQERAFVERTNELSRTHAASDIPVIDLSGEVLMGMDFSNQDLAGIDFRRSVLTGADFTGANLTGANFGGAKLQGAYFNSANLIDADLRGASAQAAKFIDADLRRADLTNANFTGTDLTNADLRGAKTKKLILNGAVHKGAKFDPVSATPKSPKRLTPPKFRLR
jgi:uncharacterized protein YjbI with pentapeptide repeats